MEWVEAFSAWNIARLRHFTNIIPLKPDVSSIVKIMQEIQK